MYYRDFILLNDLKVSEMDKDTKAADSSSIFNFHSTKPTGLFENVNDIVTLVATKDCFYAYQTLYYAGTILQYLTSCRHTSTDVTIHCSDGTVLGHKLVLASISKMLYQEIQFNIWDENISIIMPDTTVLQISKYLTDILRCSDLTHHPELNLMVGHNVNKATIQKDIIEDVKVEEGLEDMFKVELDEISKENAEYICSDTITDYEDQPDIFQAESKSATNGIESTKMKLKLKTFQCPHCDYIAKHRSNVQKHINAIHKGLKLQCPHCEYTATTNYYLNGHIKTIHEGKNYPCPYCDYKAKWKVNLTIHISSVHEGKSFPCPFCDYKAKWKQNLKIHISSIHEGKKFLCPHCGYEATQKGTLQKHIRTVHEGLKYQCPHCEYVATQSQNLQSHIKSIHEHQMHTCPHCNFKTTQKGSLQRHIKTIHEGQKFLCPHCAFQATQKGHLQIHIKAVHEGQKFQCPHCEYKASMKNNLYAHIKSIHEGRKYECQHCDFKATRNDTLQKHIKAVHMWKN